MSEEIEVFDKLRCQLSNDLEYIKMQMKQSRMRRQHSGEEEKRGSSDNSSEGNISDTQQNLDYIGELKIHEEEEDE